MAERSSCKSTRPTFRTLMKPGPCCELYARVGQFVQLANADAGYQGPRVVAASSIRVEIVRKIDGQVGFAAHARQ